jgi:hypothetical protein
MSPTSGTDQKAREIIWGRMVVLCWLLSEQASEFERHSKERERKKLYLGILIY